MNINTMHMREITNAFEFVWQTRRLRLRGEIVPGHIATDSQLGLYLKSNDVMASLYVSTLYITLFR